jgi:hypothetical protein
MSAVIGLSALLLGVSGCSGSGPSPADPTSAHPGTAPGSPSASATPTQDPGQAAIAAVQRMYVEYNRMLRSGSSVVYRGTFTSDCSICTENANTVDGVFRKSEEISGGRLALSKLRVATATTQDAIVEGELDSPAVVVTKQGSVVQRFPAGGIHHYTWHIVRNQSNWLVASVEPL